MLEIRPNMEIVMIGMDQAMMGNWWTTMYNYDDNNMQWVYLFESIIETVNGGGVKLLTYNLIK